MFSESLLDNWVRIATIPKNIALPSFILMSLGLLFGIIRTYFSAVLSGYERIDLLQYAQIAFTLIQQVGIITIIYLKMNFLAISEWYFISGVASVFLFGYFAARHCGTICFMPALRMVFFRKNALLILQNFINSCIGMIAYSSDKWIISRFMPISQLGIYATSQGIAGKASLLPNSILSSAFAHLSFLVEKHPIAMWYDQYKKLQDFALIVGILGCAALFFFSEKILGLVFTPKVASDLVPIFAVLCAGQAYSIALYIPGWVAVAQRKISIQIFVNGLCVIIGIPVMIFAVMQLGLMGAALYTLLSAVLRGLFFVPYFSLQCIQKPQSVWYFDTLRILFTGLLVYGGVWYFSLLIPHGFAVMLILYIFASAIFLWIMYYFTSRRIFLAAIEFIYSLKSRNFGIRAVSAPDL